MNNEQREKELTIQRITNALLDASMVAEDVFSPKEGESMASAFKRYLAVNKKHPGVFVIQGKRFTDSEMQLYCEDIDSTPKELPIKLAKRVSMSDIESDVKNHLGKRFNQLSDDEKMSVLWEYGLNVKPESEGASKYYVYRCIHRNRSNKVVKGLCIVASERTDREWLSTPMASFEAKTFSTDGEMCRDINKMCRYS